MTGGSCPCHPDIETAIAAHQNVVDTQAERLGCRPGRDGWDDLISDGMVALWKALAAYDPERGNLDKFLSLRVRFRMIDGLRGRHRRVAERQETVSLESLRNTSRVDPNSFQYLPSGLYQDLLTIDADLDSAINVNDLIDAASTVDPRLPRILELIAAGYTQAEAGEDAAVGLSRTRVWQLMQLAKQSA